jgi:UDP-N-acetylmuramate: L-alanyl-gamma-D-glutamyl-meso-diaminopimelate ligase
MEFGEGGSRFVMQGPRDEPTDVTMSMTGMHNVENAAGVWAAARSLGLAPEMIAAGLGSFLGVKRRQEPRGYVSGVLVIDDFAHHPTAVRETIGAIRQRYRDRRLWAVFEPRSNTSRRNIHQQEYAAAFDEADVVTIRLPEPHDKVPPDQQLDVGAVITAIASRGIVATGLESVADIVDLIARQAQANDVILVMSNGAFGNLIPDVLAALEKRAPAQSA